MVDNRITTLEEWAQKSRPVIQISGFVKGETISIKVKPVSLISLCKSGKIPNQLLKSVMEVFGDIKDVNNDADSNKILDSLDKLDGMDEIIEAVCESVMVEPTYEQVKELMTYEQKMDVFKWTQGGAESLKPFREE